MTTLSREQLQLDRLLDKLGVFTLHGRDRQAHRLLLLIRSATPEALKGYLVRRVYPKLGKECFSVVYVYAGVPGLSSIRSFLDAVPASVKQWLETVYFLHPGLKIAGDDHT